MGDFLQFGRLCVAKIRAQKSIKNGETDKVSVLSINEFLCYLEHQIEPFKKKRDMI